MARSFRDILSSVLQFEKTQCPFRRSFTVALPEAPDEPVRKRPWVGRLPLNPVETAQSSRRILAPSAGASTWSGSRGLQGVSITLSHPRTPGHFMSAHARHGTPPPMSEERKASQVFGPSKSLPAPCWPAGSASRRQSVAPNPLSPSEQGSFAQSVPCRTAQDVADWRSSNQAFEANDISRVCKGRRLTVPADVLDRFQLPLEPTDADGPEDIPESSPAASQARITHVSAARTQNSLRATNSSTWTRCMRMRAAPRGSLYHAQVLGVEMPRIGPSRLQQPRTKSPTASLVPMAGRTQGAWRRDCRFRSFPRHTNCYSGLQRIC